MLVDMKLTPKYLTDMHHSKVSIPKRRHGKSVTD